MKFKLAIVQATFCVVCFFLSKPAHCEPGYPNVVQVLFYGESDIGTLCESALFKQLQLKLD